MKIRTSHSEKGQSLVEMALTATLILFLMLATIDFGYAFLYWITIRDAAQEGAMYGSLHPRASISGSACETALRLRVTSAAQSAVINTSSLTPANIVTTASFGLTPGNPITVAVTHNYKILTPLVQNFIGDADGFITISTRVTNTILQNTTPDPACP